MRSTWCCATFFPAAGAALLGLALLAGEARAFLVPPSMRPTTSPIGSVSSPPPTTQPPTTIILPPPVIIQPPPIILPPPPIIQPPPCVCVPPNQIPEIDGATCFRAVAIVICGVLVTTDSWRRRRLHTAAA